jgi:hypothetical protein
MLVCLYVAASAAAQDRLADHLSDLLPKDARVIETANIPLPGGRSRVLALWVDAPQRVISTWDSAADFLYGDHWLGKTLLSLIDPSDGKLINTVGVRPHHESSDSGGGFSLPFFTYDGPYFVPHPDKDHRGIPLLLHLQDLTGEGVAGQFALFDYVASGIAEGSVFGYSPKTDTAVQYSVETTLNKFKPVIDLWTVEVFNAKPIRAGYWKFTWEAGHGDEAWIDEEVHFDPATQRFFEKQTTRPYPGFAQVHCDVDTTSLTDFLQRMQRVASDDTGFQWLKGLIGGASPNKIELAGMVPIFHGKRESLTFEFQSSGAGTIGIDFSADSALAAELRAELETWCSAN